MPVVVREQDKITPMTHADKIRAVKILTRALVHVSIAWTNRGFSFKSELSNKRQVCILGAIDLAMKELEKHPYNDNHPAVAYLQSSALSLYNLSAVTVNDDLGYAATIRVIAHAIERSANDAVGNNRVYKGTNPPTIRKYPKQ